MGRGQTGVAAEVAHAMTKQASAPASTFPKPVLMSFQPEWADSVLRKGTQFELRRSRCGCQTGTKVLVYTSGKVKAITGAFTVGRVLSGSLDDLYAQVAGKCGVDASGFYGYLQGLETAYAIEVLDPRLTKPVELGYEDNGKRVRGPMSFQYLDVDNSRHVEIWNKVRASFIA